MPTRFRSLTLVIVLISTALLACDLAGLTASKPTTVITSPPSGSQFRDGEEVAVQSTSTDSAGIVRVELAVDGAAVRTDSAPSPQVSFSQIQSWKATPGTHTITVRAFNTAGLGSDPAAISISVGTGTGGAPTPIPSGTGPVVTPASATVAAPTSAAPPGSTPTAVGACTNSAIFVADVTVSDGTPLAANQTFNKIWRVKNNGTCTWGPGYQFVFVGGEPMTTTTATVVPSTAAEATADLLVPMTAPAAPGVHSGRWQLKSPTGQLFGVTVNVTINVLGASPSPRPPSGCVGTPAIASFTASPPAIASGQSSTLSWGLVSNADAVEIDQGIGGVATPGSTPVTPGTTTTYTLTAHCGTNTRTAQATVTVNPIATPSTLAYDLVANAPSAVWYSGASESSSGYLTWADAGNVNGTNNQGFMRWFDNAYLEDGSTVGRVLETHPKWVDNGFIVGRYTMPSPIQAGMHFRARYGFRNGATGKVEFIAGVVVGGTPTRIVDVSKQATGSLANADVDLSAYAGQTVQVFLQVIAQNPAASQDWAVWIAPRIEK